LLLWLGEYPGRPALVGSGIDVEKVSTPMGIEVDRVMSIGMTREREDGEVLGNMTGLAVAVFTDG
jgi:hypothetical protein